MSIGQIIKSRRRILDMTLEEVAQKVGISRQTMSRYETGVIGNIPSDKIEALAKALNVSPGYLMGWTDEVGQPLPRQEKPAPVGDELLDAELVSRLLSLTPEEMQKVDAFVQGLLANR